MMNGINNELILAARLLLATLFLIFGWRKLMDYSGTVNQMTHEEGHLHGASGCVRGRRRRIHASRGCTHGFILAGNCVDRTSLLDSGKARLGGLLAVVHYWRRKIFDRCIARHRGAMTCGLLSAMQRHVAYVRCRTCDRGSRRQPRQRSVTCCAPKVDAYLGF